VSFSVHRWRVRVMFIHPWAPASGTADGPCRDRTYDLEIKSLLLYQLS
jgi:hypothetical protein